MIFDIIFLVILAIGAFVGWRKGIVRMALSLASMLIVWIAAPLLAQPVAEFIYDGLVSPKIEEIVDTKIDELGATETVNSIRDMISTIQSGISLPENTSGVDIPGMAGSTLSGFVGEDVTDDLSTKFEEFKDFFSGVNSSILGGIAENVDISEIDNILGTNSSYTGTDIAQSISNAVKLPAIGILKSIITIVLFVILTILMFVVVRLLAGAVDKLAVISTASHILGLAVGIAVVSIIFLVIAVALSNIITFDSAMYQCIEDSKVISVTNDIVVFVKDSFSGVDAKIISV